MSAEDQFFHREAAEVRAALALIDELLARETLSQFEVISLGGLLQDVYTGVERMLRSQLVQKGRRIDKTEQWHRSLLASAFGEGIIDERQFEVFKELLAFRHMRVHGYGHRLNEDRLKELAGPVRNVVHDYLEGFDV